MIARCAGLVLLLGALLARPARSQEAVEPICPGLAQSGGSVDFYCIKLYAAGGFDARGAAELRWLGGPFTVAVTRDGTHQWNLRFDLEALPDSLVRRGGAGFVAWAAPPSMATMHRLGVVAPGRELGPVALDRFLVFVSAEPDTTAREMRGPVVLRGESASNRLRPPDTWQFFIGVAGQKRPDGTPDEHAGHAMPPRATNDERRATSDWGPGVPMFPGLAMLPSEMALRPAEAPWLPTGTSAPMARPRERVTMHPGDTLVLVAAPVRRLVGGREVVMLGFNGQYPGPLIEAQQHTEIVVRLVNRLEVPTTVHWHGVRLENRFDGVPGSTQPPVQPGAEFVYRLRFPDSGIFWYHPHVREDAQQDLGLYGNIVVRQDGAKGRGEARVREEFLVLDDLLMGEQGLVPYGAEAPTHAAMGRFGNILLVNGEPRWQGAARPGETVRLYLTNVANTRTFNLSFGPGVKLQVVGSDLGLYARPPEVESVVIAPAERYIVDVTFTAGGSVALMNRVRAIDHLYGRFFSVVDTLGVVSVPGPAVPVGRRSSPASVPTAASAMPDAADSLSPLASRLSPSHALEFFVSFTSLPFVTDQLMRLDSAYANPVEWEGTMPTMNWSVTGREAHWMVRDVATGRENMAIQWRFRRGEQVVIRLINARNTLHAMQHPIHLHGQRFQVLAVNGKRNENPVWKDTVLLPAGTAIDVLAEMSNPGTWMLHCHIAEHLQAGMMMHFEVE